MILAITTFEFGSHAAVKVKEFSSSRECCTKSYTTRKTVVLPTVHRRNFHLTSKTRNDKFPPYLITTTAHLRLKGHSNFRNLYLLDNCTCLYASQI